MNGMLLSGIKDLLLVIAGGAMVILGNIFSQKRTIIETYREKIFDKSLDIYENIYVDISKMYKKGLLLRNDINNEELRKEYNEQWMDYSWKIIFDVALFGDSEIMTILRKLQKATALSNITKDNKDKALKCIFDYIEALRQKYGIEQLTNIETLTELFEE
jgi:hypothetical protein